MQRRATCLGCNDVFRKVLLFRSFHIFYVFLWSLSIIVWHLRQYLWIEPAIGTVSITVRPNHCFRKDQTCLENTQSLQRCVRVSGSVPHNLHIGSFGQLRLIKLSALGFFLCSSVQVKNLHFGSAFAFQIGKILNLLNVPWNWMQYALLAVYSSSAIHRHPILSSLSSACSCVCLMASHSTAYSWISYVVLKGVMWEIHRLSCKAFQTIRFFLFAFLYKVGAMCLPKLGELRSQLLSLPLLMPWKDPCLDHRPVNLVRSTLCF